MDLSIIIVNYNVKEFLQNLIHSIHKAGRNLSYEIIVVDNASDDGSIELLKEKFPEVNLIANDANLGFSKANNIGLKNASGKYILLLNPDTIVAEDTFEKMIDFFKGNPQAGLAGCKILNPDGTLQLACRRSFPGPWTSFCKVTGLSSLFPQNKIFARYNLTYLDENDTYEVDAISGSFMMFPKSVFEKIGGLDERFFMYGEDLDFCYRIQQAGYKVFYVHSTQIIHYKGESTKRSSLDETKFFYNAMHLFVKKHLSSSFLVEIILRIAIALREFFAFLGKKKLILLAVTLDFFFFNISLFAAEKLYMSFTSWDGFNEEHLIIIFLAPAVIHILTSAALKVYRRNSLSVLRTLGGIILSFFILSSLTFFFKQFAYSRAVVIITYAVLFFIIPFWRIILKLFFHIGFDKGSVFTVRALVVGTNKDVARIAKRLQSNSSEYHNIVGLIGSSHKEIGNMIDDLEIIGSLENIKKVINHRKINEVIFSSDEISYNQIMGIVSACQDENVDFKLIGNGVDFLVGKTSVSLLDDVQLIDITYNISNPSVKFIKLMFDKTLAIVVLFSLYPLIYLSVLLMRKRSDFTQFILKVPQVVSGKFSFVGPKSERIDLDLYLGKPGLTGLWYIEKADKDAVLKLDIFYAKNQNVWLDLEILGKTLNKMWSN